MNAQVKSSRRGRALKEGVVRSYFAMKPSRLSAIGIPLALMLMAPAARAQVLYGSLTGNVSDTSKASVPGVKVEARNVDTNIAKQAVTDERGNYSIGNLQ